jgi:hypothetical protein
MHSCLIAPHRSRHGACGRLFDPIFLRARVALTGHSRRRPVSRHARQGRSLGSIRHRLGTERTTAAPGRVSPAVHRSQVRQRKPISARYRPASLCCHTVGVQPHHVPARTPPPRASVSASSARDPPDCHRLHGGDRLQTPRTACRLAKRLRGRHDAPAAESSPTKSASTTVPTRPAAISRPAAPAGRTAFRSNYPRSPESTRGGGSAATRDLPARAAPAGWKHLGGAGCGPNDATGRADRTSRRSKQQIGAVAAERLSSGCLRKPPAASGRAPWSDE